jgi:hypothetical membrane protein
MSEGTAGTGSELGLSGFPADDPNTWLIVLGLLGAAFAAYHFKEKALWIVSWLAGMFLLSMTNVFPGKFVRALSVPSSIVLYLAMTASLTVFLKESTLDEKRLFPLILEGLKNRSQL